MTNTETTKSVAPENINQKATAKQLDLIDTLGRQVVEFPFTMAKAVKWHFGPDMEVHKLRRGTASELIDALKSAIANQEN